MKPVTNPRQLAVLTLHELEEEGTSYGKSSICICAKMP